MEHTIKVPIERPDIKMYTNIIYKTAPDRIGRPAFPQRCHMIFPDDVLSSGKRPVFLWIGGGGWMTSTPERRMPELGYYAAAGFAVVSVGYRVSSEALWPAQLEDITDALRFLKAHEDEYCLDMRRVILSGGSAGAHLAAMTALTQQIEGISIRAVVCHYGPFDLRIPLCPGSEENIAEDNPISLLEQNTPCALLLGGRGEALMQCAAEASPILHVSEHAPAFLLLHGIGDRLVHHSQSEAMYRCLTEHGVEAELYLLEGAGHASREFSQPQVQQIILKFAQAHVQTGSEEAAYE